VLALLVLVVGGIALRRYLLLDRVFIFLDIGSDTANAFYPWLVHVAGYLRTEGLPTWSFSHGMGQNILPAAGLADPFNGLLFLLGPERLALGIAYAELLKMLCGASLFYASLRLARVGAVAAVAGGLMYGFSGFMSVGGTWYVFSTGAVHIALLLLSVELLLRKSPWLMPLAIGAVAAYQAFDVYLYA